MARGNDGQDIYFDNDDRQFFLGKILDLRERARFSIHAFCLMGNHFHLLLEMAQVQLQSVMQRLLCSYSKRFNWRHNRRGHLFQERYKAILCPRDSYFLELVRYIHLNPVRAGFVPAPEAWAWSGHNEMISGSFSLLEGNFVRGFFGAGAAAIKGYQEFVNAGIGLEIDEAEFDEIDPAAALPRISTPENALMSLGKLVAAKNAVPEILVIQGRKDAASVRARNELILAATDKGFTRAEIAAYLGLTRGAISRTLTRLDR